ncbi:MAG: hypothetical protein DME04_08500 [Candidatus Rokuibacteriota bacterium]|nr:MAG: hypothetical protein DME04_08500 [Candidatus Rokubacteria bacterium]
MLPYSDKHVWSPGITSVLAIVIATLALGSAVRPAQAVEVGADFADRYTAATLGSVPGLPPLYGGLTFIDNNTILIGGQANTASGRLYTVGVVRDVNGHIIGFSSQATLFGGPNSTIGAYNDGGVVFGPGGVLFTSRWPVNELGQTKPGSTSEDKIINLAALGVAGSHAALNFVPAGFGGAGQVKLVSWSGGQWYTATLSSDGLGTFNLVGLTPVDLDPVADGVQNVPGGPEGFVYIKAGNPDFALNSMLISEYSAGDVGAYEVDGNGNPIVGSRRLFLSGLTGAEGAAIDPLTGDFLFSTFGGGDQIFVVQGFNPPSAVPEPAIVALLSLGVAAGAAWVRSARRRRPTA